MIKKCRLINGIHQQSLQVYYSYQPTQAEPKLSFTRFFKIISSPDMRNELLRYLDMRFNSGHKAEEAGGPRIIEVIPDLLGW